MPSIPGILEVAITRTAVQISRAGFGVLLIVGENASFGGNRVRTYNSLTEVAADFSSGDIEYLLASDYFAQEPKPTTVKIGLYTPVQYVGEFTFDGTMSSGTLACDVNGESISVPFNTDLDTTVSDLATAIQALDSIATVVTSGSTATSDLKITITATEGYTLTITNIVVPGTVTQSDFNITIEGETYADALTAIAIEDKDFYGVVIGSRLVKDLEQASSWVQANGGLFATADNTADYLNPAISTDWMSTTKASGLTRTINIYSGDTDNYAEAAWFGRELPKDPGTYTMKFKSLVGIEVDKLTATQKNSILDKNGNTYTEVGGANIIENGTVASGLFVDSIRGQDWLGARILEAVYAILVSEEKVQFTDVGVATLENAVRQVLENGVNVGYVAQGYSVNFPTISEVSEQDRLARELNDVTFEYNEQGAIHKVTISGVNNG